MADSGSLSRQSQRTPPEIVAAAADPATALATFIAQELERWGFEVRQPGLGLLAVDVGDTTYIVTPRRSDRG